MGGNMKLAHGKATIIGEDRAGLRAVTRRLNPFLYRTVEFDLDQAGYKITVALESARNRGSVAEAHSALVSAERLLFWNGYGGKSSRVELEDSTDATIAQITEKIFGEHRERLERGDLAPECLSISVLEKEIAALRKMGHGKLSDEEVEKIRENGLNTVFYRLEKKIKTFESGPKNRPDWPWDTSEHKQLLEVVEEYLKIAQVTKKETIDTQAIIRAYCIKAAQRSADAALSAALNMSEALWFFPRWSWKGVAESNMETAIMFARKAKAAIPQKVNDAKKLIEEVLKDEKYEMAREAERRKDELYEE